MVWRAVDRVCKQLEISNPNMETLALRSINPRQRLEVVEAAIEKTDRVGLVIIDGISDLVTSINDEEQATNLSSVLMRLTEEIERTGFTEYFKDQQEYLDNLTPDEELI